MDVMGDCVGWVGVWLELWCMWYHGVLQHAVTPRRLDVSRSGPSVLGETRWARPTPPQPRTDCPDRLLQEAILQLQRERDEQAEQTRLVVDAHQDAQSAYLRDRDALHRILGILRTQGVAPLLSDDESA